MSVNFQKEYNNAKTVQLEAQKALQKETDELVKCQDAEKESKATFNKFDNLANLNKSDEVKFSNKATELNTQADNLSKSLSTVDEDLSYYDEQMKNCTNADMKNAILKSKQDKQLQIQSKRDKITQQVAELRKQAIQQNILATNSKKEYETNKEKADAAQKELIDIQSHKLPKENSDVEQAKVNLDNADKKVSEAEQNLRASEKKKGYEKTSESKLISNKNEGYDDVVERKLTEKERQQNAVDSEIGALKTFNRREKTDLAKLNEQSTLRTDAIKHEIEELNAIKNSPQAAFMGNVGEYEEKIKELEKELELAQKADNMFFNELISRGNAHVAKNNAEIANIHEKNNMIDPNVKPVYIQNLTDVNTAFQAKQHAQAKLDEIRNFEASIPSYVMSLGQCESELNADKTELQNALGNENIDESQKQAIKDQLKNIEASLGKINSEKEELTNKLNSLQSNKDIAKQNLKTATEAHENAIEINKNERELLKKQHLGTMADVKWQEETGNKTLFRSYSQGLASSIDDQVINNTEKRISDIDEKLSKLDVHSEEYAKLATEQANLMNEFTAVKNGHYELVDKVEDKVDEVYGHVTNVATAFVGATTKSTALASATYTAMNSVRNVDRIRETEGQFLMTGNDIYGQLIGDDIYGKSNFNKVGTKALKDFAAHYAASKVGGIVGDSVLTKTIATKFGSLPATIAKHTFDAVIDILSNISNAATYNTLNPDEKAQTLDIIKTLKDAGESDLIGTFLKYFKVGS